METAAVSSLDILTQTPHGQWGRGEVTEQIRTGRVARCPQSHVLFHEVTGQWRRTPCGGRRCVWCGPNIFCRIKRGKLFAGMKGVQLNHLVLLTLTAPGGDLDVQAWNAEHGPKWNHFITLLRREPGCGDLEYARVVEEQKRMAEHDHVVLRGLGRLFLNPGRVQELAQQAGFGRIFKLQRVKVSKGGVNGALAYLGKYLTKSCGGLGKLRRVVTFSQGWLLTWENRKPSGSTGWQWLPNVRALVRTATAAGWCVDRSWLFLLDVFHSSHHAMSEARARASGAGASAPA